MKVIDLLNKKENGTLIDGFEFLYEGSCYAYFKTVDEIQDIATGTNIGAIYELDKILSDEVEVIEEKEEIKEIEITERDRRIIMDFVIKTAEKTNELVRELNKLTKEREEK